MGSVKQPRPWNVELTRLGVVGLPNVQFFPYDTLEARIAKPDRWKPSPERPGDGEDGEDEAVMVEQEAPAGLSGEPTYAFSHLTVPKEIAEPEPEKKIDLASALQYGQADGYPPLLSWVRQFTRKHLHPDVPYRGGPEVTLTVGSTDGFAKTLELFVNPWSPEVDDVRDRPGLLVEKFVYALALTQAMPKGVQTVPVEADDGGMKAYGIGGLQDLLANWDEKKGRRPHLLYTVT